MTKAKYVYIDDFNDGSIQAIKDGLNDTGIIEVDFTQVKEFKDLITDFEGDFKKYDGIILDLRLDLNPSINVKFTATGFAQEIKNRSAAEEGIRDVPIVLCSTDKNIREYYNRDTTGHDLFDYRFLKEARPNWEMIAFKLHSISKGYDFLNNYKTNLPKILGRDITAIDPRIIGKLVDSDSHFPTHDYVQQILKEIIQKPGPLINENFLAARLGINIRESPDWQALLDNIFIDAKYYGVFSDGWSRWWADLIITKFKSISGKRLSTLNAEERVDILIKNTAFARLVPAKPITNSVSTNFWTICEYYKSPLDPLEGFRILYKEEPKPWQEQQYLSFEAAAERHGLKDGLKVHPSEYKRLESVKKLIRSNK